MKVNEFIPKNEIIVDIWNQQLAQTHYPCLESPIIAHFLYEFLLTLALQTGDMCMALMSLLYSLLSSYSRILRWAMPVKLGNQSSSDSLIVMAMFDSPSDIKSTVNMLGRIPTLASRMHMRAVSSVRWTSITSSAVVKRSSGSRSSTILSSRCSLHACIDELWEFATKLCEYCLHQVIIIFKNSTNLLEFDLILQLWWIQWSSCSLMDSVIKFDLILQLEGFSYNLLEDIMVMLRTTV